MNEENSMWVEDYCRAHTELSRFNGIVKWIKKAGALITVEGKEYIDFPKYNEFILRFLDEDRNQIRTDPDFDSAHWHEIEAFDFFHTRHEFMNQIRHSFLRDEDADLAELRRRFKVVSPKFREIAERFVLAIDLELELHYRNQKPKATRKKAKRKPQ